MKFLLILCFMLTAISVNAESLVESYAIESDRYLFQLTYRCLDEHVRRKSNSIDPKTSLPVSVVSDAYVALPFNLNVAIVGIQYIGNNLHYGAGMHCYYNRQTGELLAASSNNAKDASKDTIVDINKFVKSNYHYRLDDVDSSFGIKLNYDRFIERVKNLSEEEKLELTTPKIEMDK